MDNRGGGEIMNYKQFVIDHITSEDVSERGGTIKVDVSELFPEVENAVMGAYQNYLGGGMLGAIVGASMFEPTELNAKDQKKFYAVKEACKKYLHSLSNHVGDEWEEASFEENQKRAVSAY